jgi:hypothetical protein
MRPRRDGQGSSRLDVDDQLAVVLFAPDLPPASGDIPHLIHRAVGYGQRDPARGKRAVGQTAAGVVPTRRRISDVSEASTSYASLSCLVANDPVRATGSSSIAAPPSASWHMRVKTEPGIESLPRPR